jgi:hypothetical protein
MRLEISELKLRPTNQNKKISEFVESMIVRSRRIAERLTNKSEKG